MMKKILGIYLSTKIARLTNRVNTANRVSIALICIMGCSTPSQTNLPASGKEADSGPSSGVETLVLFGTNDIHGALTPTLLKSRETGTDVPVEYEAGGAAMLSSYAKVLRSEFKDHFVWLDAGDEFQGSIESNSEMGAPMVQFFNQAGLTAAAIGNHEFDFGVNSLTLRMKEAKYPYLAANIEEKQSLTPASFPNTLPHLMIQAGHLKVGVIGLSTRDTPFTTQSKNVKDLLFTDLKAATLQEADALRKQGANVILLTAHVGPVCHSIIKTSKPRYLKKISDPQGSCNDDNELVQLLRALPAGTLDAVISGHTHQVIHQWIEGVPVVQGGAFGRYFNVVYLNYDWSQRKVLPEQTVIEGPIPVCTKVFRNQNDCNGDRTPPRIGRGALVRAKYHGQIIEPDFKITSLIQPTLEKAKILKERVIATAIRPIEIRHEGESPLGNLAADALKDLSKADFALINSGGIRAPLLSGPIHFEDLFRSFPFDNEISLIKVTEQELKMILRIAESGTRGVSSVSGLRVKLLDPSIEGPSDDLNGDGLSQPWKVNRLLGFTLPNGQPLEKGKLYTLATIDFLVNGGDDFKWPMSQIPKERVQISTGWIVRDAIEKYMTKKQTLNSENDPLLNPQDPRIKFEKIKLTPAPSKRKSRRKRKL